MSAALLVDEPWRVTLSTRFAGLQVDGLPDSLSGAITGGAVGAVGTYEVTGTTQVLRRSALLVKSGPADLLKVCVQLVGTAVIEQDGRVVELAEGSLGVYDTGRPYTLHLTGPWRCAVMTVPRGLLALPERVLRDSAQRPHPATSGAGRLLAQYVLECSGMASAGPGAQPLEDAGVALLSAALGVSSAEEVTDRAPGEVRRAVLQHVQRHLADPQLTPASIAVAHHMSLRSLHRLFQDDEHGIAGWIRVLRLEAVRRDLEDPGQGDRTIAEVAARWCISDRAWLSRAFARTFGAPPSEHRRRVLGPLA